MENIGTELLLALAFADNKKVVRRLISAYCQGRTSLRLMYFSDRHAHNYLVSGLVTDLGYYKVAKNVIHNISMKSKAEEVYWTFLLAFIGINFEKESIPDKLFRVTFLDKALLMAKNVNPLEAPRSTKPLLIDLRLWLAGRLTDRQLMKSAHSEYTRHLDVAVTKRLKEYSSTCRGYKEMFLRKIREATWKSLNTASLKS